MEGLDLEKPAPAPVAAGFWPRTFAFLFDCLLLGLVGVFVGWALFDVFARMGGYARLIGFAVALAYFGVLNSSMGGGQTLGKRLLGLRVVGKDGQLLSLPRSLLRYAVLGVPFFLNGAPVGTSVLATPLMYVVTLVVFGGLFAILYLYLFNRHGRRSLHDLATGSSVVKLETPLGVVRPLPVWRVHYVVVGVLLLVVVAGTVYSQTLAKGDAFKNMLAASAAVTALPSVQTAQVAHQTVYWSGKPSQELVVAGVQLNEPRHDDTELAKHIAQLILANDPKARTVSVVQVNLVYGYNLGIASATRWQTYRFATGALSPVSAQSP